jgi:hypothetical protein
LHRSWGRNGLTQKDFSRSSSQRHQTDSKCWDSIVVQLRCCSACLVYQIWFWQVSESFTWLVKVSVAIKEDAFANPTYQNFTNVPIPNMHQDSYLDLQRKIPLRSSPSNEPSNSYAGDSKEKRNDENLCCCGRHGFLD